MELIRANTRGNARRATLNGRPHVVVPMTMLVPGVLAGSNGPLYYPPAELARTVDSWNGMDVVAPSHPTDASGQNVSARSPGVLDKYGIGRVYNARIRGKDGALVGDAWLDEQSTREKFPQLLDAVTSGKKVELSTGLYTKNRPVLNGKCPRTGREYQLEALHHRPDHLAVLLSEQGACSLADGCGLGVNAKKAEKKPCCDACKNGKPCQGNGHKHAHDEDEPPTGNWCNQHGGTTCTGGAKTPAGVKPQGKGVKRAALQAERDRHLAHAHDVLSGKLPATDEHLGKLAHGLSRLTAPQVKALREEFAKAKAGKGIKAEHVEAVKALALKRKANADATAIDPKKTEVIHKPGVGTVYQDRPAPPPKPRKGFLYKVGRSIGKVAAALDVVGNCGGEGGKPGPCPAAGGKPTKPWTAHWSKETNVSGSGAGRIKDKHGNEYQVHHEARTNSDGETKHVYMVGKVGGKPGVDSVGGAETGWNKNRVMSVEVRGDHQRRGIASALYDHIEKHLGAKLHENEATTPDGEGFWHGRKKAGKGVGFVRNSDVVTDATLAALLDLGADGDRWTLRRLARYVANCGGEGGKPGPCPTTARKSLVKSGKEFAGYGSGTLPDVGHNVPVNNPLADRSVGDIIKAFTDKGKDALDGVKAVTHVDVKTLKAWQGLVYKSDALKDLPQDVQPIKVVKYKGHHVVWDGNHRAAVAHAEGRETLPAHVLDLDDPKNHKYLKAKFRPTGNSAPPDADALAAVSKELAGKGAMPGYGQVFRNGGHVWYVGGDGDEWDEPGLPDRLFARVPGVTRLTYEAETFPPVRGGWERVHPAPIANCGGKGGKPGPCPTKPVGHGPWAAELHEDRYSRPVSEKDKVFESVLKSKSKEVTPGGIWPFPPVTVKRTGNTYDLEDGHHRLELAKRLGMTVVPATLTDVKAFGHSRPVNTFIDISKNGPHKIVQPDNESLPPMVAVVPEKTRKVNKTSTTNSSQDVPPEVLAANLWSEAARAAAAVARRLRRRGKLALRKAGRTVYGRTIGSIVDDVKDAAREVRESRLVGVVRRDLAAVKKKAKLAKRFAEHKLRQVERGAESDASRRKGGVTPARVVGRPGPTLPVAKRASAKPPAPAGKTAVSADDVRTVDDLKRFMAAGGKVSVQGKPARPKPAPSAARRKASKGIARFSHNADGTLVLHANPAGCNQHTGPGCSGGGGGALDVALGLRLAARQATGRAFGASHAAMAHGTPHTLLRATEAARKLARRAQQGVGGAGGTPRHHSDASRAHRKAAEAHDAYREAKAATPEAKAAHLRAATAHREAAASHAAVAGHLEKEGPMTGTHRWDERVPVHNLAVDGRVVNCGGEGREARPLPVRQGVPGGRGGGPARGGRRVVGLTGNNFPGGTTVKRLNRAKVIAALTGNCDCWKGAEKTLEALSDDQLRAVKGGADVEAAALVAYNAATGETQVTCKDLVAFVANAGKKASDEDSQLEEPEDRSPGKKIAGNSAKPFEGMTDEQAFDALPPSLQKIVRNAKKVEDARKTELVGKLTANCAKDKLEAAKSRFTAMDLDTLEDLAAALPVGNARPVDDDNPFRTAPVGNAGEEDDEDGLFLNAAKPANRITRFGPAADDRTGTVVNAGKGVVTADDGFDVAGLDEVIAANSVFDRDRALANGKPGRK